MLKGHVNQTRITKMKKVFPMPYFAKQTIGNKDKESIKAVLVQKEGNKYFQFCAAEIVVEVLTPLVILSATV